MLNRVVGCFCLVIATALSLNICFETVAFALPTSSTEIGIEKPDASNPCSVNAAGTCGGECGDALGTIPCVSCKVTCCLNFSNDRVECLKAKKNAPCCLDSWIDPKKTSCQCSGASPDTLGDLCSALKDRGGKAPVCETACGKTKTIHKCPEVAQAIAIDGPSY